MSMNVNSAANLVKTTSSNDIYSMSAANQKKELDGLFAKTAYMNDGEKARGLINPEIERLTKKIAELEKVLERLIQQAEENRHVIENEAKDLSAMIMKIDAANARYLEGQKQSVDSAVSSALKDYENGNIGKAEIASTIQQYLISESLTMEASAIENLFTEYNMAQSNMKSKINNAASIIDDNNLIKTQMGATKATLALLTKTRDNMGTAAGAYANSDTSISAPIYTPKKEAMVDNYIQKYTSRYADVDDKAYKAKEPATAAEKAAMTEDFKKQFSTPQTQGVDPYSISNNQVKKFGDALSGDNNIVKQMADAGFSRKDIVDTINQVFPSIGIAHKSDGNFSVPYGHGAESKGIYDKFVGAMGTVTGALPDPAKTLAGNTQMQEMQKAVTQDNILQEMKNNGFTYKEAMYAMTRLFPGANIGYEIGKTKLELPKGDDAGAQALYKTFGDQTKKLWGADVSYKNSDYNNGGTPGTPDRPNGGNNNGGGNNNDVNRTDPIGFANGNTTYEFMVDRDQDGKFDGIKEMVGANGTDGMKELSELYDKNGDGKINGSELDEMLILRTNHDNRDYGFISASEAGIKEIDLNSFKDKTNAKGDDYVNINNALNAGNFSVTLNNNNKIQGYQKFETDNYIDVVYDKAFGRNTTSKLAQNDVTKTIEDAYKSVEESLKDVQEIIDAIVGFEGSDDSAIRRRYNTFKSNTNEIEAYRENAVSAAKNGVRMAETTQNIMQSTAEFEQAMTQTADIEAQEALTEEESKTEAQDKEATAQTAKVDVEQAKAEVEKEITEEELPKEL